MREELLRKTWTDSKLKYNSNHYGVMCNVNHYNNLDYSNSTSHEHYQQSLTGIFNIPVSNNLLLNCYTLFTQNRIECLFSLPCHHFFIQHDVGTTGTISQEFTVVQVKI